MDFLEQLDPNVTALSAMWDPALLAHGWFLTSASITYQAFSLLGIHRTHVVKVGMCRQRGPGKCEQGGPPMALGLPAAWAGRQPASLAAYSPELTLPSWLFGIRPMVEASFYSWGQIKWITTEGIRDRFILLSGEF